MKKNLNFVVLLGLFFGWGFVTCLNDLLTPILKDIFVLNQFQANFVSFAFFLAYFIGSLIYVLSQMAGIGFFTKLGYKGLILFGLILSALGCLIFIPAAVYKSYYLFLLGLFFIGFAFTFLQISANPLVIISGDKLTGASRLNLAGGFNSLATTIAPLLGVYVFYKLLNVKSNHNNLKYPYIFLAIFFILLFILIYKFLNTDEEHVTRQDTAKLYSLNHANLLFGTLAIFFYVGSEVTIGTNLINYLKSSDSLSLTDTLAGTLLAFYWGGAMIGRFLGGIALRPDNLVKKIVLLVVIATILIGLLLFTTKINNTNIIYYIGFIVLAVILFLSCNSNPRLNLIFFALVNIINVSIVLFIHNSWFSVWALLSVGVFNSIMWSNIFDLAIANLGKYCEQASSFLIMMILGGAILPVIQGKIADNIGIAFSFIVPVVGYIYILCYGVFYSKKKFNFIKYS